MNELQKELCIGFTFGFIAASGLFLIALVFFTDCAA